MGYGGHVAFEYSHFMLLLSIPIFILLATGNVVLIAIGLVFMSILIAITYAPLNAYMVSLFPHQYRYSGFGVAFNVGICLAVQHL